MEWPMTWSFGKPDSCPTSTHKKKLHVGKTVSRQTIKKELPMLGKANKGKTFTSVSYIDHVVCACGAEHDVEWMDAGI
jgi:hypothetical protein